MNRRQLITIVLGLTAMAAWAQTDYYWLSGRVHDNFTDAGIKGANFGLYAPSLSVHDHPLF